MIERIDETNLGAIVNPSFREYAAWYVRIERRFRESVAELGLPFGCDCRFRVEGAVLCSDR